MPTLTPDEESVKRLLDKYGVPNTLNILASVCFAISHDLELTITEPGPMTMPWDHAGREIFKLAHRLTSHQ